LDGEELWKSVVVARYGEEVLGNVRLDATLLRNGCSSWWKGLCGLDKGVGWFAQVAVKKMGSGNTIKFWKDVWIGNQPLEHRFPRLYTISTQHDLKVHEVGFRENGVWRWNLRWRRNFFVWEEALVLELEEIIGNVIITEVEDRWSWSPDVNEGFSVKSLYVFLENILLDHGNLTPSQSFAFKSIWKSAVPSKVSALAWQVFLNRIPSKMNLARRGIVHLDDTTCPLCGDEQETSCHIFLHCRYAAAVWYAINRWLGVMVVLPADPMMSYCVLVGTGGNKKIRRGFSIVWLAYIWVLWRVRNDRVFNNLAGNIDDTIDNIQRTSWLWYLNKTAKSSSLLYEWVWNPGDCMMR
jgi:hypothetical protein